MREYIKFVNSWHFFFYWLKGNVQYIRRLLHFRERERERERERDLVLLILANSIYLLDMMGLGVNMHSIASKTAQ